MRKPVKPIVPHHPVHHGHPHHRHGPGALGQQRGGSVGAVPKKPAKPKRAKARKPVRKWSPPSAVACCSAQALGTLLGWDWQQVLELYWRTASDPDAGASIEDTLRAAGALRSASGLILGVTLPEPHAIAVTPDGRWWSWGEPFDPHEWPDLVVEEAWCLP